MTNRTFKQLLTSLTDFFSKDGKDVPINIWDSRYDEPQPEETFWGRKAMFVSRLPGGYMLDLELDNFFRFRAGEFASRNKEAGYSKEEAWKDCVRNNKTRTNFYIASRQVRAESDQLSKYSNSESKSPDQDKYLKLLKLSKKHESDLWKTGHAYYKHASEMREKYKPYFYKDKEDSEPSSTFTPNVSTFETKVGSKTQFNVTCEELSDTDSEYEIDLEKTNLNSLSDGGTFLFRLLNSIGTSCGGTDD